MRFLEEILGKAELDKDPFSFIGEPDGKGNIVFVRHYRNDPNWERKSKPLTIPASKFWGTAKAVQEGKYTPNKIRNSRIKQLSLTSLKKKQTKK